MQTTQSACACSEIVNRNALDEVNVVDGSFGDMFLSNNSFLQDFSVKFQVNFSQSAPPATAL